MSVLGLPRAVARVVRVRSSAVVPPVVLAVVAGCGGETGVATTQPASTAMSAASVSMAVAPPVPSPSRAVKVGLERLDAPEARPLKKMRIGLIANAASVTSTGEPGLAVMQAHGIHVVRLFAPEHGLSAIHGAGDPVGRGGAASAIPVVSLYEPGHLRPTAADLRGLDALVYDLQDAGARFFTYVSTMIYAQQAAASAGIRFVVLDRPNPLGGNRVAGPVADLPKSFVSVAPGPLVHGLTAGEMARLVQRRSNPRGDLLVVPMEGWRRSMTWADTGRRWVRPSPSLRSAQAALLYPGTALLEGTTATEGRGTAAPFRIIGAPWADVRSLLTAASGPGVDASSRSFTPRPTAAVPEPKFSGQRCAGIAIRVIDDRADAFALGLRLLRALRGRPGFRWLGGGRNLDTLVGTRRIRRALDRGASVETIIAAERADIAAWRREREPALLYGG